MIIGLRWLLVISDILVIAAGRNAALGSIEIAPLTLLFSIVIFAVYNLLLMLLLFLGFGGSGLQLLAIGVDSLMAVILFWAAGASPMIMLGVSLLPVIVATVRFGTNPGLALVALIGVIDLIVVAVMGQLGTYGAVLLPTILFLFVAVGLVGLLGSGSIPVRINADDTRRIEKNEQSSQQRARAIYEMAATLGATLDYNKVLNSALDVGLLGLSEMGPDARLIGMVMLFEEDELRVATSRRLTRQDESKRVPGKQGILAQALRQAEPVFQSDVTDDPELKYFAAFQEARSVMVIPLRAGFDNYGLIVLGTPQKDAFSEDHVELLTAIGTQATIALQNAALYETLRVEKERIVEVEEDARKKLARDLHDGPTQSIAAIAMRVNYIRKLLEKKPEDANEELVKVEELARRTTKEIRHMLFTLRPLVLETQGLGPALQQFAQKMKETHDLDVTVQVQQGAESMLESHAQGVLFYVVEEAVGNARKHAQAEHINVRLYRRENNFIVEVQDDGVGFDIEAVNTNYDQRGSLGMVNMRERAALVEGHLRIDSAKGKGTKISVIVPLKEPAVREAAPTDGSQRPAQLSGFSTPRRGDR